MMDIKIEDFIEYIDKLKKENDRMKNDLDDVRLSIFPTIDETISEALDRLGKLDIKQKDKEELYDIMEDLEIIMHNVILSEITDDMK